jgi:hypothetical protein
MGISIEKISKSEYSLLKDVVVESLNYKITVMKGLEFDGASIPKAFWSIVGSPFTGNYTRSALVHDALYMSESLDRKTCDNIFLDLMRQDGVSLVKRTLMYLAVRVGGYFVWKKHKSHMVEVNNRYVRIENV